MTKRFFVTSCLTVSLVAPSIAAAVTSGVGLKASTLGAGIEYEAQFNEYLGLRAGLNYFQFDSTLSVGDIEYDTDVTLQSLGGLVDWYPFGSVFRVTGGLMYNGNEGDIRATPDSPVIIGSTTYQPEEVGTLSSSVDFNSFAPYAGIGWSSNRETSQGLSVNFDVGILFQGSPNINNYQASGSITGDPSFQEDVNQEVAKLEDDLDSYKYYPVIAFTLLYRF